MWIPVARQLPGSSTEQPGGLSDPVLVSVDCDNDVQFVAIDRYDPHSGTWEMHRGTDPDYNGQHVTHWALLPFPATDNKSR